MPSALKSLERSKVNGAQQSTYYTVFYNGFYPLCSQDLLGPYLPVFTASVCLHANDLELHLKGVSHIDEHTKDCMYRWTTLLPPTIQKWSQNILDTNAAILRIWIQSVHSSDQEMEPQLWGPADTGSRPITSQSQVSVLMFHPIFMASNNQTH